MAEDKYKGWEVIRPLGEGGQSTVFLARSPERAAKRKQAQLRVGELISGINNPASLLENISEHLRPDGPDELGALKVFDKARRSGAAPEERIRREIEILAAGWPNLPRLLDADLEGKWMVTEYFPAGTLDKSPEHFKGDALAALKAFRPLLETVSRLHAHLIIHRDIKPANVFIGKNGQLIIGDFGIAFKAEGASRVTVTNERVGPWDYMPQWGDTGERLEEVKPSFDIYMLGKLLWCMISGKLRLPREYHRQDEHNLSQLFPNDRRMHAINSILDKCIVERESACLQSAYELLDAVDDALLRSGSGFQVDEKGEISLPCFVCGKGAYVEETPDGKVRLQGFDSHTRPLDVIEVRVFSCNVCTHRAFFSPGFPDKALRPTSHSLPLDDQARIAYTNLHNLLSSQYQSTRDLTVLEAVGQASSNVMNVLTNDNLFRLSQDTATLEALQKQITATNLGLQRLQSQILATASHFANANEMLAAIAKLLSLFRVP